MKRVVLDRFEDAYGVCTCDGQIIQIERSRLPEDALPGDTLIISGETIYIDAADTRARKARIQSLMDQAFQKRRK